MTFTGAEFYSVMVGVVPLYVAMFLGYGSLRWWKLVQVPEQCVGIAQLNTYFLRPAYVCHFLAFNNPYNLSLRILAADFLSKAVLLCVLCAWALASSSLYSTKATVARTSFDWVISIFMLATLPNTVIVGIPLLQPMYGEIGLQGSICIISAQFLFWYNVCIVLFEVRAAALHLQISTPEDMQIFNVSPDQAQLVRRFSILHHVLKRVLYRLLRQPILYGSVLGFTYSLLASRCGFNMLRIVEASLQILTNMTLGTSMFILGVFMANQPSLLPCGLWKTIGGMVIRFGVAPAIMAIASVAVGIRGNSLRFAITQAAFPQGIMTFLLAKEYNMYADVFATAVTFHTLIFLPFVLLYYVLLGML
ncbi:unnamed protein product [Sphagnum balticum]